MATAIVQDMASLPSFRDADPSTEDPRAADFESRLRALAAERRSPFPGIRQVVPAEPESAFQAFLQRTVSRSEKRLSELPEGLRLRLRELYRRHYLCPKIWELETTGLQVAIARAKEKDGTPRILEPDRAWLEYDYLYLILILAKGGVFLSFPLVQHGQSSPRDFLGALRPVLRSLYDGRPIEVREDQCQVHTNPHSARPETIGEKAVVMGKRFAELREEIAGDPVAVADDRIAALDELARETYRESYDPEPGSAPYAESFLDLCDAVRAARGHVGNSTLGVFSRMAIELGFASNAARRVRGLINGSVGMGQAAFDLFEARNSVAHMFENYPYADFILGLEASSTEFERVFQARSVYPGIHFDKDEILKIAGGAPPGAFVEAKALSKIAEYGIEDSPQDFLRGFSRLNRAGGVNATAGNFTDEVDPALIQEIGRLDGTAAPRTYTQFRMMENAWKLGISPAILMKGLHGRREALSRLRVRLDHVRDACRAFRNLANMAIGVSHFEPDTLDRRRRVLSMLTGTSEPTLAQIEKVSRAWHAHQGPLAVAAGQIEVDSWAAPCEDMTIAVHGRTYALSWMTDAAALKNQAERSNNCVGGYVYRALAEPGSASFLARVDDGEGAPVATVEIVEQKEADGSIRLSLLQCEGVYGRNRSTYKAPPDGLSDAIRRRLPEISASLEDPALQERRRQDVLVYAQSQGRRILSPEQQTAVHAVWRRFSPGLRRMGSLEDFAAAYRTIHEEALSTPEAVRNRCDDIPF